MKLIIAIIKPFKVAELVDAVQNDAQFPGMTVHVARGFGRGKTAPHEHLRDEDLSDFTEHSTCYIAAPEEHVGEIVRKITAATRTGATGDGKIMVLDLVDAVRIGTGETGEAALR